VTAVTAVMWPEQTAGAIMSTADAAEVTEVAEAPDVADVIVLAGGTGARLDGASKPDVVARVVPLFVAFALVMPAVGDVAGRMAHQGRQERLALAFSGTTRNSLVVLPLALALPDSMGMAPIVVVTQTLVELVVMAIGVRLLPRLIR